MCAAGSSVFQPCTYACAYLNIAGRRENTVQVAGRALAGALLLQATGRPIRQADPVLCAATVIVMTLLQVSMEW